MSDNMNSSNMLMDWDDVLENDGTDFLLLEDGDYNFVVTDFERGRFPGSAKIPPCNKATVTLRVDSKGGAAFVRTDLILYRTMEWKLSSFFRCIGLKKHGERLSMDWSKVIGSKGRARFKQRSYKDKDGNERFVNDVESFLDFNPDFFPENAQWVKDAESAPYEQTGWEDF